MQYISKFRDFVRGATVELAEIGIWVLVFCSLLGFGGWVLSLDAVNALGVTVAVAVFLACFFGLEGKR